MAKEGILDLIYLQGPSLKYLSEINNEQDLKKSFILFVHDLLSFSYKILENTKSDYKYSLENNK